MSFSPAVGRWAYTFEIMVSKIFPAGAGWQFASTAVDFDPSTADFALVTGLGDATGVVLGHVAYKTIQRVVAPWHVPSMKEELGVAAWLGGAAFCAGTAWQPIVNAVEAPFAITAAATGIGCALAFFGGLRAGRVVFPWMPDGTTTNSWQDVGLAMSIGGATGAFVSTDAAFVTDPTYPSTAPTILASDAVSTQCIKAGTSTFVGFGAVGVTQNVLCSPGGHWMDHNNPYTQPKA